VLALVALLVSLVTAASAWNEPDNFRGVLWGTSLLPHVCGDPALSEGQDRELGARIVRTALHALTTPVAGPTLFEPLAAAPAPVGP